MLIDVYFDVYQNFRMVLFLALYTQNMKFSNFRHRVISFLDYSYISRSILAISLTSQFIVLWLNKFVYDLTDDLARNIFYIFDVCQFLIDLVVGSEKICVTAFSQLFDIIRKDQISKESSVRLFKDIHAREMRIGIFEVFAILFFSFSRIYIDSVISWRADRDSSITCTIRDDTDSNVFNKH